MYALSHNFVYIKKKKKMLNSQFLVDWYCVFIERVKVSHTAAFPKQCIWEH